VKESDRNEMREKLWDNIDDVEPHNQSYIVFGTLVLWVAWLFFNSGAQDRLLNNGNEDISYSIMKA